MSCGFSLASRTCGRGWQAAKMSGGGGSARSIYSGRSILEWALMTAGGDRGNRSHAALQQQPQQLQHRYQAAATAPTSAAGGAETCFLRRPSPTRSNPHSRCSTSCTSQWQAHHVLRVHLHRVIAQLVLGHHLR